MSAWVIVLLSIWGYVIIGLASGRFVYPRALADWREDPRGQYGRSAESRARENAWCFAIGWPIYWPLLWLVIVGGFVWDVVSPLFSKVDEWMTGGAK
jgi:H+/Cl- antiporter ClcA